MGLFKPALQHPNWRKRMKAVERLTDEKILLQIAKEDADDAVAKAATAKVSTQKMLLEIVYHGYNLEAAFVAIERITSQEDLVDIAITLNYLVPSQIRHKDTNYKKANLAFKRLNVNNQNVMIRVAVKAKMDEIWMSAIKTITDEKILMWLAVEGKEDSKREAAIEMITDEKAIIQFARQRGYYTEHDITVITDQHILKEIAYASYELYYKKLAVKKLENQSILADIARNSKEGDLRTIAIEKLNDKNILAEIAERGDSAYDRSCAKSRWYYLVCNGKHDNEIIYEIDSDPDFYDSFGSYRTIGYECKKCGMRSSEVIHY